MDLTIQPYTLSDLGAISVIVGKNGCGKSTLLRAIAAQYPSEGPEVAVKYITPERGGTLVYEASIEQNVASSPGWVQRTRGTNQFMQFRQQTAYQYRVLETQVLRELEQGWRESQTNLVGFDEVIEQINRLLDNVYIARGQAPIFEIRSRATQQVVPADKISSGEAELISLAIECLSYVRDLGSEGPNLLLLDEPDVHLHPDLQSRLTAFLRTLVESYAFTVIIATHSTAILGGLSAFAGASLTLMKSGDEALTFRPIDASYQKVLPVFGAHPLSNIFNEAPILLLEGDDDVRIWQQAVRTAGGRLRLYPVECGGITEISDYESRVRDIVLAVYDSGRAFSLRDRDGLAGQLDDAPPVTRMRFDCRAAENLLLSDQVLQRANTSWPQVIERIEVWLAGVQQHPARAAMIAFQANGYDRKHHDLKDIRMLLTGEMIASSKPWEVLVGQAIGLGTLGTGADSLRDYLGEKVVASLGLEP